MIPRRMIRSALGFVRVGFILIGALAVVGVIYEQRGARSDAQRFPQIGRSVDVGGRTLNLHCVGQTSPTVILESGHGVPGLSWAVIQVRLAQRARTCWYDRAGYGWSEAGPFPQRSNEIARDLHALLTNAGVPPPYILAGHGFGAFNVRAFRGFYPKEVAGMVLIDPPSDDPAADNPTVPPKQHIESLRPGMVLLSRLLGEVGLWRLMRNDPAPPPPGFAPRDWATLSMLASQPKSIAARMKETPLRASAEQVRAAGGLDNLPLIVLSPGIPADANARQRRKLELEAALARLSSRGRHEVIDNPGRMVPYTAPGTVIEAIAGILAEVRSLQ